MAAVRTDWDVVAAASRLVLLSTVTLPAARFEELRRRERLFAREVDAQGVAL
jgi:hypothetical protein